MGLVSCANEQYLQHIVPDRFWKWFKFAHRCRGKLKPGGTAVGSSTKDWLITSVTSHSSHHSRDMRDTDSVSISFATQRNAMQRAAVVEISL